MVNSGFPTKFMDELKSKNDIVGVISSHVELTKKGQNFWGCCPFHKEKTPSFAVNPIGGFYHCFGCGASGDVIKYVMEYDGLTFMEAIEWLAQRANIEVPKLDGKRSDQEIQQRKKERDVMLSIIKDALDFYRNSLLKQSERAIEARLYLKNRGITVQTEQRFMIGLSPSGYALVDYLAQKGYTRKQMLESGLVSEREGRAYDSLANRLIIPIFNHQNVCIAFGGRALRDGDFAKYKNTKETALFVKNSTLFGLNVAKTLRSELKDLILVEGYMDCISLVQSGIENVCASMGTSLTENQAEIIRRFVQKVYICYDGDSAGQAATLRGLDILAKHGLEVLVMSLPDGMDPDDVVRKKGRQAFEQLKQMALPLIDYKLKLAAEGFDLSTTNGKSKYAKAAVEVLRTVDKVTQMAYLPELSRATGIAINKLEELLTFSVAKVDKPSVDAVRQSEKYVTALRVVLRCLAYSKSYALVSDLAGVFSKTQQLNFYEHVLNEAAEGKTPVPSIVYEFFDENEALAILSEKLPQEDINVETEYFLDCVYVLKLENYKLQKNELKLAYQQATEETQKNTILGMLNSLVKPKR